MRDVLALEPELTHRRRGNLGGVGDLDLPGRREVERASQTAAENVGRADARLPELLDSARGFGCREDGLRARVDRRLTQRVDVRLRVLASRGNVAHRRVEVSEFLDREPGEADE